MIDNSILSIYTQRSHHGITYSIFSHPAQQRSGTEPRTATSVCACVFKVERIQEDAMRGRTAGGQPEGITAKDSLIDRPCFDHEEI